MGEAYSYLVVKYDFLDFTQEELYDKMKSSKRFELIGRTWHDSRIEIKK